nr:3a [Canine coronavirus 2]
MNQLKKCMSTKFKINLLRTKLMSHYRSCMDIVKSIDTSIDAVIDEFDRAYFAVILKVEFKTGKLLVCIGFGDTLLEAKDKAYAKLGLSIIEEVNSHTVV